MNAVVEDALITPAMFRQRIVHIIGVGSLGSAVFQNLIRMQVERIVLWDVDVVEARNRFNQRVFEVDINAKKILAQARIAGMIDTQAVGRLELRDEKVTKDTLFDKQCIVIAAVDSMAARVAIWNCVRGNPNVSFFVDGRLGMVGGKVFGLDPNNVEHIARYEDPIHLHADPVQALAVCKTEFPMPAIADIIAGHMLWRMVRWFHLERGSEDPYDNFVGLRFVPSVVQVTEQWDQPLRKEEIIQEEVLEVKVTWRDKLTSLLKRLLFRKLTSSRVSE